MWINTLLGIVLVVCFAAFVAYLLSPDVEEWVHDRLEGARGWMGQVRVDHVSECERQRDPRACDQLELHTSLRPRQMRDRYHVLRARRLQSAWKYHHPGERAASDPCDRHCVRVLRDEGGRTVCMVLCA